MDVLRAHRRGWQPHLRRYRRRVPGRQAGLSRTGLLLNDRLSGSTRVAGVIGWPVAHSRSPAIHNAAFAHLELDIAYVAFAVPPGAAGDAIAAVRSLDLLGLSVTMPHKAAVIDGCDEVTPTAQVLGAVNHVINRAGTLVGDNTDGHGFLSGLQHDAGTSVAGRRVLVVGAGGAARAVILACAQGGAAEVIVAARDYDKAERAASLAGSVGSIAADFGAIAELERADLVVNATPIGMVGTGMHERSAIGVEHIRGDALVVDLVYEPESTPMLHAARQRGLEAHGGLSMLVGQAAVQFTNWTGLEAPFEVMMKAARTGTRSP